jgi:DNA repair exonuclease SbcCD ATPase subunit
MPRKRTAHQELAEHRERVASEATKFRELQEQRAQAEAELERIGDAIASAYASEDGGEIAEALKAKEEATARVEDLEHRTAGASLRAERAREGLATFMRDHARDLLDEREETARAVATELTKAVAAVVKAHRAYIAERQHVDRLVSQVPGATARYDGVSTGYSWEAALKELERVYREHPEAEPPRPRWSGMAYRRNIDTVHRQVQARRRKPNEGIVDAARSPVGG